MKSRSIGPRALMTLVVMTVLALLLQTTPALSEPRAGASVSAV